ncbi:MAG: bifunctional folylpolyglutamate synthase/dihydrofolate synthase [Ruminococcaceae bacterium]|nr:bifunctional folylpolyglutamate synthase/dihydrofolate synthase [Oscillospiraceae bacterium]
MTYQEALDYIHSVTWKGSRPGLERITELCHRLGDPQNKLKFIHVAGTNGKGSTSAMLSAVLSAAGYRVGLFTSPFILRFNERMQVNGRDIPDDVLADVTAHVRPHADAMADAPTEFELITAIAFEYFRREACDIVVLEVGMGGRLDSTNVIPPESVVLSVITGIALDHTAFLGDTPEAIAKEKAGIIKPGTPILFGGAHPAVGSDEKTEIDYRAVAEVIRSVAEAQGAPYAETDHHRLSRVSCELDGATLSFGRLTELRISLPGVYQPYNAATVLTALELLEDRGYPVTEAHVRQGLTSVRWPGRFEILCRHPLVISDGGHNPEGVDAAVASAKAFFKEKIYLLSGVMADKDYHLMVRRMAEVAERVFTVRPDNDRALSAADYASAFREEGVPAEGFDTVELAVHAAMDACLKQNKALLTLGSLYMYGEVRAAVKAYTERSPL